MRMTALDVQNHHFPRRFKGYDVDEVEQFRAALVEDWAALTAENDALRRCVQELEKRIDELDSHETTLRNALVSAQGMSDDLRRTAEHEAQMRVGQAELKAEKILAAAHRQTSRLAQDVRELRNLRSRMTASVRATIETHLAMLEGFAQAHEDDLDPATERRLAALASPEPPPVGAEPQGRPEARHDAETAPAGATAGATPAPTEPMPEPRTGPTHDAPEGRAAFVVRVGAAHAGGHVENQTHVGTLPRRLDGRAEAQQRGCQN